MNPTAIIKIMGALAPLMGNKDMSDRMVAEIQSAFRSMDITAQTLVRIENRLVSIDQKLTLMGGPVSETDIATALTIPDYQRHVEEAIKLGETHNAAK